MNAETTELDKMRKSRDWWKDHAHALDKNWYVVHEAAMGSLRKALGMPDGSVPDMIAEIQRLQAKDKA